jgi:hypothetical protein
METRVLLRTAQMQVHGDTARLTGCPCTYFWCSVGDRVGMFQATSVVRMGLGSHNWSENECTEALQNFGKSVCFELSSKITMFIFPGTCSQNRFFPQMSPDGKEFLNMSRSKTEST